MEKVSWWVSKVDWNALYTELWKSIVSILYLILGETFICLPLELTLGGAVYGAGGAGMGSVLGAEISLTVCGADFACRHCGGSVLVGSVVPIWAAPVISVLGDEPPDGTGSTVFPVLTSNTGAWFEKFTSCATPLFESFLDHARAALSIVSFFFMVSAWLMTNRFCQLLLDRVLRLLYLVVSKKPSCPTWNWGEAFPTVRFRTSDTDPAWGGDGHR